MTRHFTVTYTPEQAADPLLGPDEVVKTAAEGHEVGLTVNRRDAVTVDFTVASGADSEVDHLLKRLRRHDLTVTERTDP